MRVFVWIAVAGLALGAEAGAQISQSNLQSRLLGKTIYLRGFYADDKLKFNEQGVPQGATRQGSFTLSGVAVENVETSGNKLSITGRRMGLIFRNDVAESMPMLRARRFLRPGVAEEVKIEVECTSQDDCAAPLNAIFATDLAELVPLLPEGWQRYGRGHFLHDSVKEDDAPAKTQTELGAEASPPKLLKRTKPDYSEAARAMLHSGKSLVTLVVDTAGMPTVVSVGHPTGLGLDEEAMRCVSEWRFAPAMKDGKPVAFSLLVQVDFRIF